MQNSCTFFGDDLTTLAEGIKRIYPSSLEVSSVCSGYVAHGPYRRIEAGRYLLSLRGDFIAKPDTVIDHNSCWELFDSTTGKVLLERQLNFPDVCIFEFQEPIDKVEVRLFSDGTPFLFHSISFLPVESFVGLTEIEAKDCAEQASHSDALVGLKCIAKLSLGHNHKLSQIALSVWLEIHTTSELHARAFWALCHSPNSRHLLANLKLSNISPFLSAGEINLVDTFKGAWNSSSCSGIQKQFLMDNACNVEVTRGDSESIAKSSNDTFGSIERQTREDFKSVLMIDCVKLNLRFQADALRNHEILGKSLWNGAILSSNRCFVVPRNESKQSFLFYLFEDVEPWYLVVCTWRGSKSYAYIPGRQVLLSLTNIEYDWGEPGQAIVDFAWMAAINSNAFVEYFQREVRPAIYASSIANLGHFFWNDVQGILSGLDRGDLANVRDVLHYKFRFLDLNAIFPVLAVMNNMFCETREAVFLTCLTEGLFCVRLTDSVFTKAAAEKVVSAAKLLTDDAVDDITRHFGPNDVLIWFNLRAHNKVWLEQVDGALDLARHLTAGGRRVHLFLDGTPDCAEMVSEIVHLGKGLVEIIDGTNLSLASSIVWATKVNAYVATIGSGLTLVTWIAGKPGVAHSETAHLEQMTFWHEVRQDVVAPVAVPRQSVRDIDEGMYSNYTIKNKTVTKLLAKLLKKYSSASL